MGVTVVVAAVVRPRAINGSRGSVNVIGGSGDTIALAAAAATFILLACHVIAPSEAFSAAYTVLQLSSLPPHRARRIGCAIGPTTYASMAPDIVALPRNYATVTTKSSLSWRRCRQLLQLRPRERDRGVVPSGRRPGESMMTTATTTTSIWAASDTIGGGGEKDVDPKAPAPDDGIESADGAGAVDSIVVDDDENGAKKSAGPATSYLSSLGKSEEERDIKRNELKLKKDVQTVKEAAKEVEKSVKVLRDKIVDETLPDEEVITAVVEMTGSASKLGGKIIDKGPSILGRVFLTLFSKEIREDFKRRRAVYVSDWTDAFASKRQTIPAILFLYFACLAPVVSFGTIASQLTNGSIGVVEFLLSCGCSGMVYAALCGQPMAFIAPTGLTLAFISGLFRFCTLKNMPFFPIYSWVGIWTSLFMVSLGMVGSSKFIRYCTRFTDEVFNGLLSINFIYEATSSLRRNFQNAPDPSNLTMPFVALSMALGTFYSTLQVTAFQTSKYFNQRIRTLVKDFGPVFVFVGMSILNVVPSVKRFSVPTLIVPQTFELAGGRDFVIPLRSVSMSIRILCAFPAVLLTALFFMDQNISVRVTNNPDNKLKKGPAYNIDMVALGLITFVLSVLGLPWMCGATVQSLNHLRAMTTTRFNEETNSAEIESVTETRFTGFTIHALIFATIQALPLLSYLPIPVVSGVFLFLGRKLMIGNSFIERIGDGIAERKRLPDDHPIHVLGRKKMNLFTTLQVLCLFGLWTFKQNPATAIFFPSVIGMLMVVRSFVLPKFFSEKELVALGDPTPT